MQEKIYELFKSTVLSPEFIILVLIGLMKILLPSLFNSFGKEIKSNSIILNTTIPVMGFLIVFGFTNGQKILQPKGKNKDLYKWENYWKIKYRVYISFLFILFSAVIFCLVLFFKKSYASEIVAFLYFSCMCVALITNISLFVNAQKINEVIEINT